MKNLINYLSKKSLSLGNGSGMTRKWFGNDSGMTRLCLASLICLCMLTVGVGNAWGAYTYSGKGTFNKQSTIDGDGYYVIILTSSGAMTNSASSNYVGVNTGYNGTSSATISNPATSVVLQVTNYDSTNKKYYINNNSGNYLYSSADKKIAYSATSQYWEIATVSNKARLKTAQATVVYMGYVSGSGFRPYANSGSNVQSVSAIYKLAAATPTVTPDPTSLSWGTVLQGSSQGNKTISITGANLTAGTLTISATGGYSVTPTSKSVSGTLAATTLTVTPPSTSTTGAKNGKVTISGGGLASSVEVNLSMTVNAASTVTWMNNGSEYTTTLVENGSKPTFPDNPTSCDGTSTTFYGWSTSEWAGKFDDVSAKTIYTSASAMPTVSGAVTYYAVFCKGSAGTEVLNEEFDNDQTTDATSAFSSSTFSNFSGETSKAYKSQYGGVKFGTSSAVGYITSKSLNLSKAFTVSIDACKYGSDAGDIKVTVGSTTETISNSSLNAQGSFKTFVLEFDAATSTSTVKIGTSSKRAYIDNVVITTAGTASQYLTTCCTDPGLNYGTGSVTKTFGEGVFTNTLTNSHSVAVTYSSSDPTVATVNGSGQVTILKAGSTTITASSAAQTVAAVSYCADEASYTLTVNKANISPTLTYTPNSVAAGSNTSAPTVGGNPGSGGVTYAITSASPAGCATINTSTGVVTGVAVGSVTVTATVAATTNYNGGSATANVTITAASYFTNGATVFIQAESSSAWDASACVKAWFNNNGAGGAAQETFWLFDATGGDAGKKLFATVVPASGSLNQVTLQRFDPNSDCDDFWNANGTLTKASDGGSNTFRSTGSGNSNVAWNGSGITLSLYGDPNSWGSSLGTFADQGNGVWTATYNNYAPANAAGETQEFKISTNYNGWIGNTGSNNNATLDGMHVGSTYNITATLDVKDHSLTMSKTFVKGTVHFNLQGHGLAISDLTNVTAGSKISAPSPAPSATGYDFGGWYKEPACTNAWNFGSDVVNETMTLYAKWTKQTYTITSTLNNCSSSPAIPSSYEYTGSAAGLSYTITPSSGYRLPTDITVTGTTYTWNSSTGALVLTGTITSNVTITISAVQTHTVDWYVGGSDPANKIGDDGQTTVVDHGGKISAFPATTPDGSPCDKTFVGWTNTSSYVHGTSPLFNDVAGSPVINANASFYAVFATGSSGEIFSEDFASFTSGSISSPSSSAESSLDGFDNITYVYQAGEVAKLGTGSYSGSLTTDELTIAAGSSVTISFEVFGWTSVEGDIIVSCDNSGFSDQTVTYTATRDQSMESKSVTVTCTVANPKITIATSTKRAYIDNISISASSYTGHTITCADCGTSVTPTYTAAPTGGTVSVTKSATPVSSGSTVKTCTSVDLTVTITPASHYTLTGFTATGLSTGTATISPAVGSTLPKTTETTFTVTVSSGATGTLNLTPTFTEDAHVAINWHVPTGSADITAGEGKTWVYSGGNLTAIPGTPSNPTGCSEDKTFVGWSEKHSGSTEEDASYYDDLFSAVGDAPTGITSQKDFYAVYAHGSSNPLAGTVIWDEPFTGFSADDVPTAKSSGATVYNSTVLTYACADGGGTTKIYSANLAGGTSPELLVAKSGGSLTVSNIPTAGQTELTLSYKANYALEISSGTSGVTIGDASVEGSTYTRTITISQSPSAVNNFSLAFTKSTTGNARLDDIHLVVPGSSSYTNYVTDCEAAYIITYIKNTTDPVTNLPGETGIPQSTGAGTLSSKVPVRDTYTFLGWATTAGGNVAYAAGGSISGVSADMDLYAVWEKTPVEELFLNYSELNKYVGDPAVTLEVTGVTPEGADATVTWSSNNSSVASVVAATGVVTFGTVGTATITATSTVTGTTTAYCYVTVRNKPTASFTDLIHDGNGTDLSTYHMQNVAGTEIVFPTLDDYATPGDDCDSKHYIFVGWTTSDNNDDPEDHLVALGELEDDQDKVFYAVWADGEEGVSYTQLTTSTFKTSPTKYVIGAIDGDDTFYFNSCAATDANNGNGGCTNAPGTNAPIEFTLSGTAGALVATSTEATARYLTPLTAKNFQMSATSKTIQLNADGTIANPSDDSWTLRFNTSEDYLRWYSSATGNAAYFYEVTSGAAVSYRTSCCTNNVAAPTVVATNTAYTVTLTWAAVDGATGYEVSWNGGAFTAATSPCVKSDLTASTDYTYKVRATYDPLVKCGALVASGSVTTDDVYSVTYSGGTGTGSCSPSGSVAPASYEAGATVTLAPTNSFSLTSNTFAAWVVKDADDNDVPVSNNQFTMPAKNVTVTATWTAVQDKYYDRMHDGTDASHGGIADGEGKYYLVLEGCNYTVPTLTDDDDGDTDCHTTHYKLLGWIAQSHLKTDGSGEIKTGEESYIFQGGGTKSATGATYYAIWAIMTE